MSAPPSLRIGIGFDRHRLEPGGPLRLGGLDLESEVRAVGHSDGDALLHALCDAVLGAAGRDDLGALFPPGDPRHARRDSSEFADAVRRLVGACGFRILSLDAVVLLERPRLAPHRPALRARIAALFGLEAGSVNVKGKTGEGLGAVGEGRAIEVHAVALLATDGGGLS